MAHQAEHGMKRRSMQGVRVCAVAGLLLWAAGTVKAETRVAPRAEREGAVAEARTGDTKDALATLRALVASYPGDARLLADTTIVANWAGDDAYALELYARAQTPKDDAGVTEAAARSARNLHHYDKALDLYRSAAALAPDRWQPLLGQALVLIDEGQYRKAAEQMKPLLRARLDETDVETGEAYLCSRQGDYSCVIDMDQRLMEHRPQDSAAIRCQMAQALARVGAETLAEETCSQSEPTDDRELLEAKGAERIRWAEANTRTWAQRRSEGEEALKALDGVIAASPTHDDIWKAAEFDRLLALFDLRHMHAVIDEYDRLHAQKIEVPTYALACVAGTYLALHHPRHAEALYRTLVKRAPGNGEMWGGLTYAQFEREHLDKSFHTVDLAYAVAPSLLQAQGLKVTLDNEEHTSLGLQAAEMRGYADMSAQEAARLAPMLAAAPANQGLNRAMAMNYLARGWPLLAMRQERIADSYAQPDALPVLEDAEVLDAAGRRDEADAIVPVLLQRDGYSASINHYLTNEAIERGWQADAETSFEWSSGKYIGTGQHSDGHLYSPLFDNRWRAYVHALGDTGRFQEGPAYRSRAAAGVSYDYGRQAVWAEIGGDNGTAGAVAAGAVGTDLNYRDHWTLRLEGDSDNVTNVQLITQLGKVRARSATADLGWRQSELRDIHAGVQRMLFSDGNQRTAFTGSLDQRAWTTARVQVTVTPELWTSSNSENPNRIYFNPKADFSMGPSTTVHWLTWRRYSRKFTQDFTVYMAPYWQENYGVGGAVAVTYQQRFEVSKRFSAFSKVTWDSQPYNGSSEPYTNLEFGVKWGLQ
jgi:biofilm PGA synthesis protein PgaA